jgi:hypothetical protein
VLELSARLLAVARPRGATHGALRGLGTLGGTVAPTDVESHVRYGAFLRGIPPARRVGDYAHAAARVVNAVFKRLLAAAPQWGPRAAAHLHPDVTNDNRGMVNGGDGGG